MADAAVGKDRCGEQRLVSLPLSRIRVIMKSSPEVSSINQEALVLTAKATVSGRRGGERGGRGHQPPLGLRTRPAFRLPWGGRAPQPLPAPAHSTPQLFQLRPSRLSRCPLRCFRSALSRRSQRSSRPAHRVIPAVPRARRVECAAAQALTIDLVSVADFLQGDVGVLEASRVSWALEPSGLPKFL